MNIWWIRRDLRIFDNQALTAAMADGARVIPVFILDPRFWNNDSGMHRSAFLIDGLHVLSHSLAQLGSKLIIRSGQPLNVLHALVKETGAEAVYAEEDYTPYARQRDAEIAEALPLHLTPGLTVFHPNQVLKPSGDPYTVFTPFSKRWQTLPQPTVYDLDPAPEQLPMSNNIESEALPERKYDSADFPAGESHAQERLQSFLSGPIFEYQTLRNRPDLNATSGLSPYFKFGMISARAAVTDAIEAINAASSEMARKGAAIWLTEIIWREFFQSILFNYPFVVRKSFREAYRGMQWENHKEDFDAWKEGRTGYPFVDAAMRQLQKTGWMHNRPRMIVASFLVKDLLIDWRWGERWFMDQLVDGDTASNNGGWQWSAGTGTDAAPYFRIFNPITQSKKFDPSGDYIRRWIPELKSVNDNYIHEPWKMPEQLQRQSGCLIGKHYPEPIIDHHWARTRALNRYKLEKSNEN